jgi:hypothetical protein
MNSDNLNDGIGNPKNVKSLVLAHQTPPSMLVTRHREKTIPSRVRLREASGRMIVANVYEGRNMAGIKPGEIKKLLVLETLPMPIHYTGGMEPISYGGTFTLERISRPDQSLMLLAPLAQSAGGWQLCCDPNTKAQITVIADTTDPDYETLLALCSAGKRFLVETSPRFVRRNSVRGWIGSRNEALWDSAGRT